MKNSHRSLYKYKYNIFNFAASVSLIAALPGILNGFSYTRFFLIFNEKQHFLWFQFSLHIIEVSVLAFITEKPYQTTPQMSMLLSKLLMIFGHNCGLTKYSNIPSLSSGVKVFIDLTFDVILEKISQRFQIIRSLWPIKFLSKNNSNI